MIAGYFGRPALLARNVELEYRRNAEQYAFLPWGQQAPAGLRVVPPGTGICHQASREHPGPGGVRRGRYRVLRDPGRHRLTYPDGQRLGVLGWGFGGIEAEAAMLVQPLSMLIPRVIGVRWASPRNVDTSP